ncbi:MULTISPECIES: hypothetical protein [Hoeflea]|jgi:hypothetical protein|uniref:Saccharopine dehydrogenase NADP binding domain-containing protein n=1 Tax=Hoeflea algicola TaxID=2983763 RepID=A0ABT3ZHW4_9HYPH|nr:MULTISPECIES: hypothetical protein [Hoeflea]MCY0150844.1 hypothetical protein [Hoeflea algicola]
MPIPNEPQIAPKGQRRAGPEIWLIGGAGDVGSRLTSLLLDRTKAAITIISRSDRNSGGQNPDRLCFRTVDIRTKGAARMIPPKALVVNLTEATPPELVAEMVANGCTFLETSASPAYVNALRDGIRGRDVGGVLITCVGMAPGLIDLMAEFIARNEHVNAVDIGIEMGLGRHYGAAATEWFLATAGTNYSLFHNGSLVQTPAGALQRLFVFDASESGRLALGFGFAGREILTGKPAGALSGRRYFVAIDPPLVTRSLSWALSLGLGPWIARNAQWLSRQLSRFPGIGQIRTRMIVEGLCDDGMPTAYARVTTGDQADATATMILATLNTIMSGNVSRVGLATIIDYLTLADSIAALKEILPETRMDISGIETKAS